MTLGLVPKNHRCESVGARNAVQQEEKEKKFESLRLISIYDNLKNIKNMIVVL